MYLDDGLQSVAAPGNFINQSNKIYFPSNKRELQCNKCYSTWKATRKPLRSLKLVAWTKNYTNINTLEKRKRRPGTGCNLEAWRRKYSCAVQVEAPVGSLKDEFFRSWSSLQKMLQILTAEIIKT